MRTLVLGGRGFVGTAVRKALLAANCEVFTLGTESWDLVVDVTGTRPEHVKPLLPALSASGAQYCLVSSCTAETAEAGIGVGSAAYRYGEMKLAVERAVRAHFPKAHLIVRPPHLVGRNDPYRKLQYWHGVLAEREPFVVPNPPTTLIQMVDVRDFSSAVVQLVDRGTCGTVTIADKPASLIELLETIDPSAAALQARWVDPDWLRTFVAPGSELPFWDGNEARFQAGTSFDWHQARGLGVAFRPLSEVVSDARTWSSTGHTRTRSHLSPDKQRQLLEWWSDVGADPRTPRR